ncbi:MAG TPA: sigma-54 dependent transcriptional regulator [Chitinophagaceae bacterium]|nr:sigma-54 dependent transcriptional regulator [Chitinophagaceae bacterium]
MVGKILIIDDEEGLRKLIVRILALEGYQVEEAATLKAAEDIIKRKDVDVILCDVKLPDGNGIGFVKDVKAKYPLIEIILLTAYGNIADGVLAIKNGAFDYITKGNDNDRIIPLLSQATEKVRSKKKEAIQIHAESSTTFQSIIGNSRAIQRCIELAEKIAPTNTTVLLLGETGTGKEVFAKAIHSASGRKQGPFVAVNCSAFTKELLESELFGHKAGAYTGAVKDKKGLMEVADGGTLFLDEIGEMNVDLQAKLLRVLENGEFIKLGDTKVTKLSVRIIAATNRDLQKEVQDGHFREDLLYRLNTFTISLPSLKERREDIIDLANYFLHVFAQREGRQPLNILPEAREILKDYTWKGNIRELRNVMERAVILSENDDLDLRDLPSEMRLQEVFSPFALAQVEKDHIRKIFEYTGFNKTRTAQLLGIGLATLYRKLEEYGLSK